MLPLTIIITLTLLTITHAECGRPTPKEAERCFRNGPFRVSQNAQNLILIILKILSNETQNVTLNILQNATKKPNVQNMLAECQVIYNMNISMTTRTNCVNEDSNEERISGKHSEYVNSLKRFSVYQSCVEYPKVILVVIIVILICILIIISMIACQQDFNNKVVHIMFYMLSRVLPSPFVDLQSEHMLMLLVTVSLSNNNDDLYSVYDDVTESRAANSVYNMSQVSLC